MVVVPRPGPPLQFTSVVRGQARCLGDAWGFSHPVPSTTVELHDRSPLPISATTLLATETTDSAGGFVVVAAQRDLRRIPWSVDLTNDFTGETFAKASSSVLAAPVMTSVLPGHVNIEFDAGRMILPWNPQLPMLARVGGRAFRTHMDLARALRIELKAQPSAVSLLLEFPLDRPGRKRPLDAMFRALEAAAASGSVDLAVRIADAVRGVLKLNPFKIRSTEDVFVLALQEIEQMTIGQVHRRLAGFSLGTAMARAFGTLAWPMSIVGAVPEMAAASVLLYAAARVAKGDQIKVRLTGTVSLTFPHMQRHYHEIEITT